MTDAPVLASSEMRLLTEIGFVAASSPALHTQAESLFGELIRLRPRRAFPYIGLATAWLNRGRPDEAASVMEQGVRRQRADWGEAAPDAETFDPVEDPAMMQAFYGLTLLAARRSAEGRQVLGSLLESCDHPPAVRIAQGLMGQTAQGLA